MNFNLVQWCHFLTTSVGSVPRYGLKGMIDASLHVRIQSDGEEATEKIVPLEFKTGKGTNGQSAMEHSAQVILYTILMSERYLENVESGLLYYLHTDVTQGTLVRRSDVLGLIMRHNKLAHDIVKASRIQQLPRMLLVWLYLDLSFPHYVYSIPCICSFLLLWL
ncbi:DNA replication ATP-dependent helicase/nuclease jhs1, variant 2 [Dionaea muscipula]